MNGRKKRLWVVRGFRNYCDIYKEKPYKTGKRFSQYHRTFDYYAFNKDGKILNEIAVLDDIRDFGITLKVGEIKELKVEVK